jgi:hypothetical protein
LTAPSCGRARRRKLSEVSKQTREVYRHPATLARKERAQLIHGPTELLKAILDEGAKGQQMQRYKGLGEMNPDQLWETTLDPEARTLLQVKIDDLAEADDIFTKLMGDVVEPRRDPGQRASSSPMNALSVLENLGNSAGFLTAERRACVFRQSQWRQRAFGHGPAAHVHRQHRTTGSGRNVGTGHRDPVTRDHRHHVAYRNPDG